MPREMKFGTMFHSKYIHSIKSYKTKVETMYKVRVNAEVNDYDGITHGNITIYGKDEERVAKAFVNIMNEFPTIFTSRYSNDPFPINTASFEEILNHPRSFGMGLTWCH